MVSTNYRRRDYTIRNGGGPHLRHHPSTVSLACVYRYANRRPHRMRTSKPSALALIASDKATHFAHSPTHKS